MRKILTYLLILLGFLNVTSAQGADLTPNEIVDALSSSQPITPEAIVANGQTWNCDTYVIKGQSFTKAEYQFPTFIFEVLKTPNGVIYGYHSSPTRAGVQDANFTTMLGKQGPVLTESTPEVGMTF